MVILDSRRQSLSSPLWALFVISWGGGANSPSAKRSGPLLASLAALCLCVTDAHADSAQSASTWPAHNRYLAIHLGQQQQNYRELVVRSIKTDSN